MKNEKKERNLVGFDSDDGMFGLIIAIIVIMIIISIMVYGGLFIGGYHSLKNYFGSFKENVIDDNMRKPTTVK